MNIQGIIQIELDGFIYQNTIVYIQCVISYIFLFGNLASVFRQSQLVPSTFTLNTTPATNSIIIQTFISDLYLTATSYNLNRILSTKHVSLFICYDTK